MTEILHKSKHKAAKILHKSKHKLAEFCNKSKHKGSNLHWIVVEIQSRIGWGRDARPCVSTRCVRNDNILFVCSKIICTFAMRT